MTTQLDPKPTTSLQSPATGSVETPGDTGIRDAKSILKSYTPINLDEMEAVALLRRVDINMFDALSQLFQALHNLK